MNIYGKTDIGLVRQKNEDSIFLSKEAIGHLPNVFVVADGMGGHNAGEIASLGAIDFFCEFIKSTEQADYLDTIVSAAVYSNACVYKKSKELAELAGMGTTLVAAVVDEKDNKLLIAHIGDSRLYVVSDSGIAQITTDHTYVNEMVRIGQLTPDEARVHPKKNIITRALGTQDQVVIDGIVCPLEYSDKILICSDGLSTMVTDEELFAMIRSNDSVEMVVQNLINSANNKGGFDNISVILIEYVA